jgi:hypothetical protein
MCSIGFSVGKPANARSTLRFSFFSNSIASVREVVPPDGLLVLLPGFWIGPFRPVD